MPNQLSQTKKILLLEEMLQGDHPLEDDEFRSSIDALKYAHGPALEPKPEISEYQVAYVSLHWLSEKGRKVSRILKNYSQLQIETIFSRRSELFLLSSPGSLGKW